MQYRSTRGGVSGREFSDVLLEGLAPDGGLYVPEEVPALPALPEDFAAGVAAVAKPFVAPDPLADELEDLAADVYGSFRHPDVAPLRKVGDNRYLLELYWGPTLSFKDYALQLVGALFERVLERQGRRLLVLGATSGDTGSAAIEACRGQPGIDMVILFPEGAVSEIQRRQMTTVPDPNVHAVAVAGTFDDCQRLVKQAFTALGDRFHLGAINSINWARIMAQAAYYAFVAERMEDPVRFVVPTGNFGNIHAAHLARRMGAPISGLTAANNANHGLADLAETGRMEIAPVQGTVAPAMDIQVPSNLERYLFEALGEVPGQVREMQEVLARNGTLTLPEAARAQLRSDFSVGWSSDDQIEETIRRVHEGTGLLVDPHTAAAWRVADEMHLDELSVVVSTAHPAKFPEVVERATGVYPELPEDIRPILTTPERTTRMTADLDSLEALLRSLDA